MTSIHALIKVAQPHFSETDKQVALFVMHHTADIPNLSISDLANAAFVSTSSVLRFTQKLGFKGFTDFKYEIDWAQTPQSAVSQSDAQTLGSCLTALIENLDAATLALTYRYIHDARRIYLLATGLNQQVQAEDLQQQFLMQSINMTLLPTTTGSELNRHIAESVSYQDLLIVFSGSGENLVVKDFLALPLLAKTPVIAFTDGLDNWLASHANCAYAMAALDDCGDLMNFHSGFFHILINYLSNGYRQFNL